MTEIQSLSESGLEVLQSWRHAEAGDTRWSLHDMCVGWSPEDGYRASFMSSNYYLLTDGTVMLTHGDYTSHRTYLDEQLHEESQKTSELVLAKSLGQFLPKEVKGVKGSGGAGPLRDFRIFWRPEGWHYTARVESVGIGVGRLVDGSVCAILKASDAKSRDWVPVAYGGSDGFDMVVGPNRVLRSQKIVKVGNPPEGLDGWRMGSPLVPLGGGGTFLGSIRVGERVPVRVWSPSRMSWVDGVERRYRHRFVEVDGEGKIIAMSEDFVLQDGGVEKLCGMAHDGYGLLLSWGRNDVSSVLGRIEEQKVVELLRSV